MKTPTTTTMSSMNTAVQSWRRRCEITWRNMVMLLRDHMQRSHPCRCPLPKPEFVSPADKCIRPFFGRGVAQVRPAEFFPIRDHADAPRKTLERGILAGLARPGFGLP